MGGGGGGAPPVPGLSGGRGGLPPGPPGPGRPIGEGAGDDLTLPPPTLRPDGGGGGRGPLEIEVKIDMLMILNITELASITDHIFYIYSMNGIST